MAEKALCITRACVIHSDLRQFLASKQNLPSIARQAEMVNRRPCRQTLLGTPFDPEE
jgi:hypothetical protein